MVCKTFNVQEEVYDEFSKFCRENGISMSKQVEMFMEAQLATEPKVRQEYLDKLDRIRKGKFIEVKDFRKRYLK
jgi:hypothetical protein